MTDAIPRNLTNLLSAFPALKPEQLRVYPSPMHIRVHPSRYHQLSEFILTNWPMPMSGVEIVQDTFVPASRTERRRRFLTKKQRSRWYVRKYRTIEVPVFGWLFETDKISSIEMKRG